MNNETQVLARTLLGEAKANDTESAIAIAHVVLNRMAYPNWPNTISEVCLQPWQFSCWNQNDPNRGRIMAATAKKDKWFKECLQIADDVIGDVPDNSDPTHRATHYHTPAVHPSWAKKHTPCYTHYHLYYNDIDTAPPEDAQEALQAERPLGKTRTVKGAQVASAGVVGSGLFMEVQKQIEPLVPYSEYFKYIFLGVALIGVGYMIFARVSDRKKGLR